MGIISFIFKLTREYVNTYKPEVDILPKIPDDLKRLCADIPEQMYKDFAKKCIEEGISKRELVMKILEKELYSKEK